VNPFVIGELACGNIKNRSEILTLLQALPEAPTIDLAEYLYFIKQNHLSGIGIGFVDVHLLASAKGIILKSTVCKLAMCDRHQPYIVPLCFGFKDNILYFHSAPKGKKIDILKNNPNVCFEFDIFTQVIKSAKACKWGMKYRSVIGYGKASFVTDENLIRLS